MTWELIMTQCHIWAIISSVVYMENFSHLVSFAKMLFVLCEQLHRGYGNLYRIGKTLFRQKFLQYKDRWAWQDFYPAKISTYTVVIVVVLYMSDD